MEKPDFLEKLFSVVVLTFLFTLAIDVIDKGPQDISKWLFSPSWAILFAGVKCAIFAEHFILSEEPYGD
ncbi:MAG: hypothetical protein ACHQ1D_00655 [Nitrososphaerales archaeon]